MSENNGSNQDNSVKKAKGRETDSWLFTNSIEKESQIPLEVGERDFDPIQLLANSALFPVDHGASCEKNWKR